MSFERKYKGSILFDFLVGKNVSSTRRYSCNKVVVLRDGERKWGSVKERNFYLL